jgi:hypothetical protein
MEGGKMRPIGSKLYSAVALLRENSKNQGAGDPSEPENQLSSIPRKKSLLNVVSRMKLKSLKKSTETGSPESPSRKGTKVDGGKFSSGRNKLKSLDSSEKSKKRKSKSSHSSKAHDESNIDIEEEDEDEFCDSRREDGANNNVLSPKTARALIKSRQASPISARGDLTSRGSQRSARNTPKNNSEHVSLPKLAFRSSSEDNGTSSHTDLSTTNQALADLSNQSTPKYTARSATAMEVMKTIQSVNDLVKQGILLHSPYPAESVKTESSASIVQSKGGKELSIISSPKESTSSFPSAVLPTGAFLQPQQDIVSPTERMLRNLTIQNSNALTPEPKTQESFYGDSNAIDVKVSSPTVKLERKGHSLMGDSASPSPVHHASSVSSTSSHASRQFTSPHMQNSNNSNGSSHHSLSNTQPRYHETGKAGLNNRQNELNENQEEQTNLMSKIGGVIIEDDKVVFIDAGKFINFAPESQEEFLQEQKAAGNFITLQEYQQIIQDVKEGVIDSITTLNDLPLTEKENLMQNARAYLSEKLNRDYFPRNTRSRASSSRGSRDEPRRKVLQNEDSKYYSSPNRLASDIGVDSPMTDATRTGRVLHPHTHDHTLDSFAFPSTASVATRASTASRSQRGIYLNRDTLASQSNKGRANTASDLLVIVAPSRREKITDTSDFEEYLASIDNKALEVVNNQPSSQSPKSSQPWPMITTKAIPIPSANMSSSNVKTPRKVEIVVGENDENSIFTDSLSPSSMMSRGKGFAALAEAQVRKGSPRKLMQGNTSESSSMKQSANQNHRSIDMNAIQDILTSSNPLATIYYHFESYLSDSDRIRLYQISNATEKTNKTNDNMLSKLFRTISPQIDRLHSAASKAIATVQKAQAISSDLIVLICSGEHSNNQFKGAAQEMYRLMGEVEVVKLWIDMQLLQYRSIFESYIALNLNTFSSSPEINNEYQEVYNTYISCQSVSVRVPLISMISMKMTDYTFTPLGRYQ